MPKRQFKSIKEFADDIRSNVDVPEGVTDEELVGQVVGTDKSMLGLLAPEARVEARRTVERPSPEAEGSAGKRFAGGMASPLIEGVQGLIQSGFESAQRSKDLQRKYGAVGGGLRKAGEDIKAPFQAIGQMATHPGSLVDLPGITKDIGQGNIAGAGGRATAQALMIASLFKAMGVGGEAAKGATVGETALKEAGEIGKGTAVDKAMMDIAKTTTGPQSAALDARIAQIDKALEKQGWRTGQVLQDVTEKARIAIEKAERAPGAQIKDVTAAKDAVDRLGTMITKGEVPWPELRKSLLELRQAKKALGNQPSAIRNNLTSIINNLEDEVQRGATKSGFGDAYKQWRQDYRDLSRVQRAYAKALSGKTETQVMTKTTAKDAPSLRIAGTTPIRFGRSKAGKIAQTNKEVIKQMHQAIGELDKRIKSAPPLPAAPTPLPPKSGTTLPPVSGGAPGPGIAGTPAQQSSKAMVEKMTAPLPPAKGGPPPTLPQVPSGGAPAPSAGGATPQWPAGYQGAPQTLSGAGGGGANYTAADLEAFKKLHGIK